MARRRIPFGRSSGRGQSLVEFALLTPVFMLILLGLLEFGMVFDHTMTLTTATREGARNGAAFANGNATTMPCTTSIDVDKYIIAAVQRVLKAPGSQIAGNMSNVDEIVIYKAAADGTPISGKSNTWTYSAGAGPSVDGGVTRLDFVQGTVNWDACGRKNAGTQSSPYDPPDSLGIGIHYSYQYVTPLAAIMGFFGPPGSGGLTITDSSVMSLNPTN